MGAGHGLSAKPAVYRLLYVILPESHLLAIDRPIPTG